MQFPGRGNAEQIFVPGPAGRIEVVIDAPEAGAAAAPRGIALVAHPHPLYGGTLDNKVAQTLARTFAELGYLALRPNFRGVGQTEGSHDKGAGETDDMLAVLEYARQQYGTLPVVLAGFSFGGWIQTRVARRLAEAGTPAERLVLVATAVGRVTEDRSYDPAAVPANTILIHGDQDSTVPLANVLTWAEAQNLPVSLVPGADHFFHRKLGMIRTIIQGSWDR
jgi:alpha/beta superfamily hydrolase